MPHLPGDRLALVRQLYEASDLTIAEIAVLADASESAIYQRARRERWTNTRRPGVTPRKRKLRPPVPPTPALREMTAATTETEPAEACAQDSDDVDRVATAARLWRAVNRHLETLEADDAPDTVIRAAQNLSTLARTLETLIDVERGLQAGAQSGAQAGAMAAGTQPGEPPEDIDAFRERIARKLSALCDEASETEQVVAGGLGI